MNGKVSRFLLRMAGWNVTGSIPPAIRKCIVIMAPHTSNWDFFIGWLGYRALGLRSSYLIKKEAFFFPIGGLVKRLGGIPVDRLNSRTIAVQVSHLFRNAEQLILTITPEGTRKLNKNWKKGFYSVARHADVPVFMGFLDYEKKEGGIGPQMILSGDFEEDMIQVKNFYKEKTARYPENFNFSPIHLERQKQSEKSELQTHLSDINE